MKLTGFYRNLYQAPDQVQASRRWTLWVFACDLLLAALLPACGNLGVMSYDGDACEGYKPAKSSPYRLPYAAGTSYQVWQGNCGSVSHHGIARFAYDLLLPIDVPVLAMRAGTVIFVKSRVPDGSYGNSYNEVHIRHDDGTVAQYVHLKQSSSMVSEDEWVEQGIPIALAGSSGTTLPHLHIDLLANEHAYGKTIPFNFENTEDNEWGLIANKSYTAQ